MKRVLCPPQTDFFWRCLTTSVIIAILAIAVYPRSPAAASQLDRIRERGTLLVVTCNGPTTYYQGPTGPAGLEYELADLFADELGVNLEIVTASSKHAALMAVAHEQADIAAAGLTVTLKRAQLVRFAPSYQQITEQLVYRKGVVDHPNELSDLSGKTIAVTADSGHAEHLSELREAEPGLTWQEHTELSSDELLFLTHESQIDYTIGDSHNVALYRRYFPELRVGFDVSGPHPLAWAIQTGTDISLYEATVRFFARIHADGTLRHLLERYYGHLDELNYVGTRRFLRHAEERLPRFKPYFKAAAAEFAFDWRLLAAISYQESHWDPNALSPTGVRGLMMLTLDTANEVGVDDREDPRQSILGGARYLAEIKQRLPDPIKEPDRTWVALVAYNIGHGHLRDVMMLTEELGQDSSRWVDIKQTLPLLERQKWYRRLHYGYARGYQAMHYVQNIRAYYDILVWHTQGLEMLPISAEVSGQVPQRTLD